MAFKKIHQPCPDCGGTDPLSINEDGSTKCFNCGTYRRDAIGFSALVDTTVYPTSKKPVVGRSDAFIAPLATRRLYIKHATSMM